MHRAKALLVITIALNSAYIVFTKPLEATNCAAKLPDRNISSGLLAECLKEKEVEIATLRQQAVPSGTIAYFDRDKCDAGWHSVTKLVGFYVVGAPEGSPDIGQRIGTKLDPNESRPAGAHVHYFEDYFTGPQPQGGIAAPGGNDQYDNRNVKGKWTQETKAQSDTKSKLPEGTNAPYVQLLACAKD